jgi:hypothetical protein
MANKILNFLKENYVGGLLAVAVAYYYFFIVNHNSGSCAYCGGIVQGLGYYALPISYLIGAFIQSKLRGK